MTALATETFRGVQLLEADVRIHGQGSPPEGDLYTVGDLNRIAAAHRELAGELSAPAKIGHDSAAPAVGWLENVRVEGRKLLADVQAVPRRFAELVRAGAYRTRSVELSRVTSQRTGRRYNDVVTAVAWLGARLPAARTLDDVIKLYEDVETTPLRVYETGPGSDSLDDALRDGRLPFAARDPYRRLEQTAPAAARAFLAARQPDHVVARANWDLELREASRLLDAEDTPVPLDSDDLAERERIAREYGIPVAEVV